MKITDIVNDLPKRVKLNKNFTLEESFDVNTILQIKGVIVDEWVENEKCYKVFVTALAKDMEYNRSVALPDWLDSSGNPTKTFYDVNHKFMDQWGNLNDVIYVMENDDCFDLPEKDNNNNKIQFAIDELNNLKDILIQKVNNLNLFMPSDRINGKIEGVNLAIEDIRKQLKELNEKLK